MRAFLSTRRSCALSTIIPMTASCAHSRRASNVSASTASISSSFTMSTGPITAAEKVQKRASKSLSHGGWRALDELRSNGVVAAIGAGVNEWQPCARLLELADPDLFLLAGRYTLLEQEPLDTLFPQCAKRGVGIVIGGPYNSGVLAGKTTFNYGNIPSDVAARVRSLDAVCRDYGVELRQAALQFVAAHPLVVSVIPGAVSPEEVDGNVAFLQRPTPPGLWSDLKSAGLLHRDAPVPAS